MNPGLSAVDDITGTMEVVVTATKEQAASFEKNTASVNGMSGLVRKRVEKPGQYRLWISPIRGYMIDTGNPGSHRAKTTDYLNWLPGKSGFYMIDKTESR